VSDLDKNHFFTLFGWLVGWVSHVMTFSEFDDDDEHMRNSSRWNLIDP
jgi:hypothetical protein